MKELDTFVKAFGEGLRTLAQGVHAIADKLENYAGSSDDGDFEREFDSPKDNDIQPEPVKETPDVADFKEKPAVSATAVVYETISAAGKSITMEQLCEETGFDRRKVTNILYRLRKQKKIKDIKKGVYAKK